MQLVVGLCSAAALIGSMGPAAPVWLVMDLHDASRAPPLSNVASWHEADLKVLGPLVRSGSIGKLVKSGPGGQRCARSCRSIATYTTSGIECFHFIALVSSTLL